MSDLISRQSVLNTIYFADRCLDVERTVENYNELLTECIKLLPTVENKEKDRPKGHWIIKDNKEWGYDIAGVKTWYIQIMCDKCGFIKTAIEGHTGQYKYCPNCGTDMRGEQNETDN